MRVVFFGTPEFAVPSLERLLHSAHTVVGVVTSRDKPRGRGLKLAPVPVKQVALTRNLPTLEPPNLKADSFLDQIRRLSPDILVVVAFRILPKSLFAIPRHGAVNVHPSLLPKYRGPAPIHWTLINGETVTGITTFQLTETIDAGNILLQREVQIHDDDDFGSLHDRLADLGAEVLIETLDALEGGDLKGMPQDDSQATPAPKVQPSDAAIDWHWGAERIRNLVRAFSPSPGAWTKLDGRTFKIYQCEIRRCGDYSKYPGVLTERETCRGMHAGQVANNTERGFPIVKTGVTGDDRLVLKVVQMEGKKRMDADAFLRGYPMLGNKLITPLKDDGSIAP